MNIKLVNPDEARHPSEYLDVRNAVRAASEQGKSLVITEMEIDWLTARSYVRRAGRELKLKGIQTEMKADERGENITLIVHVPSELSAKGRPKTWVENGEFSPHQAPKISTETDLTRAMEKKRQPVQ